jgi:hypothetical protein
VFHPSARHMRLKIQGSRDLVEQWHAGADVCACLAALRACCRRWPRSGKAQGGGNATGGRGEVHGT